MFQAKKKHHFIFSDLKNFGESDVLQINIVYKENSRRRSAVVYVLSFTEVFYFSCKILTIYPFAPQIRLLIVNCLISLHIKRKYAWICETTIFLCTMVKELHSYIALWFNFLYSIGERKREHYTKTRQACQNIRMIMLS